VKHVKLVCLFSERFIVVFGFNRLVVEDTAQLVVEYTAHTRVDSVTGGDSEFVYSCVSQQHTMCHKNAPFLFFK